MNILEVKKLRKSFGGLVAVKDIDLEVAKGSIHAIIGPNGAGKTTFFNGITGIRKADSGEIIFQGEDIYHLSPPVIATKGIARTFQNVHLFPFMTVKENVKVGCHHLFKSFLWAAIIHNRHYKKDESEIDKLAEEMLEKVGLLHKKDYYARNLPYGEQRKLEIARALASRPLMLLLDEPVAGMNVSESEELMEFIKVLREEGITVVLIEHDMKFVMSIADIITVLDYGEKIAQGYAEEIQKNEKVIEAYLGSGRYAK